MFSSVFLLFNAWINKRNFPSSQLQYYWSFLYITSASYNSTSRLRLYKAFFIFHFLIYSVFMQYAKKRWRNFHVHFFLPWSKRIDERAKQVRFIIQHYSFLTLFNIYFILPLCRLSPDFHGNSGNWRRKILLLPYVHF